MNSRKKAMTKAKDSITRYCAWYISVVTVKTFVRIAAIVISENCRVLTTTDDGAI